MKPIIGLSITAHVLGCLHALVERVLRAGVHVDIVGCCTRRAISPWATLHVDSAGVDIAA